MAIGFIGLGNMGEAIVRRLLKKEVVRVFDLREGAREQLAKAGAKPVASAAKLARECSIVMTCLPKSEHVGDVLFGRGGVASALAKDSVVIDMTTGDPSETLRFAALLKDMGVHFADSPVAGGPHGAAAGTLAMFVGAETSVFDRVAPLLRIISPNVFHTGDVSTGHVMKLVNNVIASGVRAITFEAITMAVKNGILLETLADVLPSGSARSYTTEVALPQLLEGKFAANFSIELLVKDLTLATKLGLESKSPMLLGNMVRELYQIVGNELGQDADITKILRLFERQSGVTVVPG